MQGLTRNYLMLLGEGMNRRQFLFCGRLRLAVGW
jgi:hypothetical protein